MTATPASGSTQPYEEIAPVPPGQRRLGGFDIAVLWGDLGVGLLVLVAGSLLVPGLGLTAAIVATAVGSIIGAALLAATGKIGTDTGVPTMVALRPSLGIRGSYLASVMNIAQLVGWAGLEVIIMAQASRALSDEFLGFDGYYFWLALFAIASTVLAVGGPIVVVRDFLQKFGVWIVLAATVWLTYRLFSVYDLHELFDDKGTGGFPTFWQGVDIAVSLPVSWLPLIADYTRYARRGSVAAWSTFLSYTVANVWFFFLGFAYVLVLASDPGSLVGSLVDSLVPLALGWLFLFVILVDETDNTFADIYSAAVSIQNMVALPRRLLAVLVGAAAFVLAVSVDLLGYENFLLLIGGVFVSLFGVLLADYLVVNRGRYDAAALYAEGGSYWYWKGVNVAGMLAWLGGFVVYTACAQPPALVDHFAWIANVPDDLTKFGGTIPSFVASLGAYLALRAVLARSTEAPGQAVA